MDFIEDPEGEKVPEESNQDDQSNALEAQANPLVSAEISISTTPIPLTHISNSSGNSSEISPESSPKTKVNMPSKPQIEVSVSNKTRTPIPRTNPNKME